ncbi:MAG: PilW family protein [bacterium]
MKKIKKEGISKEMIKNRREQGFTLIELMIGLALALIAGYAVYSAFIFQYRSYVTQEQVVEMNQNLRGAMFEIAHDVRMGGYMENSGGQYSIDDSGDVSTVSTVSIGNNSGVKGSDSLTIYYLDESTDIVQKVTYEIRANNELRVVTDSDDDTDSSDFVSNNSSEELLAEDIENMQCVYFFEDGTSGALGAYGFNEIRAIRITLVARTHRPDPTWTDSNTYTWEDLSYTPSGEDAKYRRRVFTREIKIRNFGLQP